MLCNTQKELIIGSDTLTSLSLFIAPSKREEMETVKRLVISVLNRNNYQFSSIGYRTKKEKHAE